MDDPIVDKLLCAVLTYPKANPGVPPHPEFIFGRIQTPHKIISTNKNFSKESSCSAPLAVTIDWPEVSYGHNSCPRLFLSLTGCCPELFQVPKLHSRILSRANYCCPKIPTVYLAVQKFSAVQIAVQQHLEGSKLLSTSSQAPKMTTGDLVFTDYLVDANDITDDEDFFEDDLNPKLGGLEPLDLDTLVHFDLNLVKEIPLDKVCLNDSNLISKETGLTLSTLNLKLKGSNLTLDDAEPNLYYKSSFDLLEPILEVAPLDLHLKESVLPDWAYHITPPTDLNENISPHFHVMPTSTLDTLPRLLSPIPAGDSLGYVIMVKSDDPSSYHTPDSYILPATSLSFPVKDLPSPSWLTLLDHLTTPRRLSVTLAKTPHGDALLAKDVFMAPPIPIKSEIQISGFTLAFFPPPLRINPKNTLTLAAPHHPKPSPITLSPPHSENFSKESSCSAPLVVTIDWPEVSYGHSSCPRLFLSLTGCCPELFQVPKLHSRILSRANYCCPKIPTIYLAVQKFSAVQIAVQQHLEGSKLLSTSSQAPKMTTGDLVFTDYLGNPSPDFAIQKIPAKVLAVQKFPTRTFAVLALLTLGDCCPAKPESPSCCPTSSEATFAVQNFLELLS
ncbi:hypothetical protein M5K25_024266 [Dendrobium thyrsiflorum]|uniref:Uncharacterized protein n=1 Tax=Dendrobium thyrsiflorum TaxID=117978 RepID=A0ABD0U1K1_DENTH